MAVELGVRRTMVRSWASMAPKATSSAAPSVRSTTDAARSPRPRPSRDSRRRASTPVSQGTSVAASTRRTARIERRRPAASTTSRATVDAADQDRDGERRNHPEHQVLERVDVRDHPGQEVAPSEGGQPRRRQPLQPA